MNSNGAFELVDGCLLRYREETSFVVSGENGEDPVDALVSIYRKMQSVIIPGYIAKVGAFAFQNCNHVSELVIEEGVKEVAENAFYGIRNLSSVWIPNTIQYLPIGAFPLDTLIKLHAHYPAGLLRVLLRSGWNLSAVSLEHIGCALALKMAYTYQSHFRLILHAGKISDFEFARCPFPMEVHLEDKECTVRNAFEGSLINKVVIGESVTKLGGQLFDFTYEWEGSAIERIDVAETNTTYFSVDGVLFEGPGRLLHCPHEKKGTYNVPDWTTSVAAGAFDGCYQLENIYIPSKVTLECDALANMANDTCVIFL